MTTLSAASASIDVPELSDLMHEKTLASARFMKSVRARSPHGFVFVKAVMKPYSTFQVEKYVKKITEERNALATIPNTLGYQRIVEVGSGGFLVRQYLFSSVYDRLSTRPFLEDIEKKWLAYQLLCAIRDCHAQEIYHGDIKTENLLVTSWNWLYLTDFSSSFKPTTLPEDNPADFSFYFDTSSRRTCYVAPERFTKDSQPDSTSDLNWAMDMFSAGCVIAEMFLEGPIFSLSQVFKYRSGEYSPEMAHLHRIEDQDVRDMVLNMIELDPEKRYNADQHLSFYRDKIFPEHFDSFLHQYMLDLTQASKTRPQLSADTSNLVEADDKIDRVFYDFDKIAYFLGYGPGAGLTRRPSGSASAKPVKLRNRSQVQPTLYDGTFLFLTLICSSLRNTTRASSRLKACDLLVAFAERLPDEAKLDRILPYIVALLNDPADVVQASAVRALTSMFEMIEVVSPINAFIFPEYIFPRLKTFLQEPPHGPNALVRAAYASCLASLAWSSNRLLDMVQAIRADGRLPTMGDDAWAAPTSFQTLYDPSREELVRHFEEATVALITDPDPAVKRALLGSVASLCVFFGSQRASDVVLTHLNTYLNEKDWTLKCSFFDALVGIASYIGTSSLEKFFLPIMVGSLTDPEGFVVEKVFRSLSRMADLGLVQKSTAWELVGMAARFLVHPNLWTRESAVQFIVVSAKYTSKADEHCIIIPMLQPYLKSPIVELSEELVLDHLKKPLSRAVYNAAIHWAAQKHKSLFWTAASRDRAFMLSEPEVTQIPNTTSKRLNTRIPPSQRDKDDLTSLETLRNLGMTIEDEMKLLSLREYIYKVSVAKLSEDEIERQSLLSRIIPLHQIEVTPQNVLFDPQQPIREIKSRPPMQRSRSTKDERHTLADALLDASTTIHGAPSKASTQAEPLHPPKPIDIRGRTERMTSEVKSPTIRVENSEPSSSREVSMNNQPSPASLDMLSLRRGKLELRQRNSAMNLINRKDSGKADAETSTSDETAFGKLDGPLQRQSTTGSALSSTVDAAAKSRSKSPFNRGSRTPTYAPNHSYTGNDPNILRLLDSHFAENFPVDQYDFGELRHTVDPEIPIRKATDMVPQHGGVTENTKAQSSEPWRPSGQLLTQFAEHTAAINRVCVAPDHAFFVTASDDGTCKIWDTMRLEKNITPRSRHTYRHAIGSKVKTLCFIENSHAFISAADDGSIHVVRVDFKAVDEGESTKYGRPTLVRDYQIPSLPLLDCQSKDDASLQPEHAVHLYHYRNSASQSILVVATSRHRILLIDLKNMEILHSMLNSVHHGSITTFVVGGDEGVHKWLLLGTSHGILSLWDLRFKLHLRSFGIQSSARVDALAIHPSHKKDKWVLVSAAGEISNWDIDKMVCREIVRPSTFNADIPNKPYEPWFPDEEASEKLIARFANDITQSPDSAQTGPSIRPSTPTPSPATSASQGTQPLKSKPSTIKEPTLTTPAMQIVLVQPATASSSSAKPDSANQQTSSSKPNPVLFTGGMDRTLRYYTLSSLEHSLIISGPQLLSSDGISTNKVRYDVSYPLSLSRGAGIALVSESVIDRFSGDVLVDGKWKHDDASAEGSKGTPSKKRPGQSRQPSALSTPTKLSTPSKGGLGTSPAGAEHGNIGPSPSTPKSKASADREKQKPPRSTLISAAAAQLLKVHMDGITDVAVLRKPYGCVVSVDRSGCIYVFH